MLFKQEVGIQIDNLSVFLLDEKTSEILLIKAVRILDEKLRQRFLLGL